MAKSLYSALFDWIVLRINHALLNKKDMEESVLVSAAPPPYLLHQAGPEEAVLSVPHRWMACGIGSQDGYSQCNSS